MIKAIFIDYTGTMVREDDPYTMQLLKIFLEHSDLKEPKSALEKVWGLIKQIEKEHYLDTFILKDEMVDMILDYSVKHFHLDYDLDKIHSIWRDSWIHAPLFDDVKGFFERCQLPIYIVTNDDLKYVEMSLQEKGIKCAGIISAQSVRACKPHKEILEEGLRVAGVNANEVILIGDSITSDITCARSVGVTPILIDRTYKIKEEVDFRIIHTLDELEF